MERTCNWILKTTDGEWFGSPVDIFRLVKGVSTDTRTLCPNQLYIPLTGEHFDGHQFIGQAVERGAAAALWKKGRPLPESPDIPFIVVNDPLKALQQLAAGYRAESRVKVIAVTGSNGKTTTKDLVASVLSERYSVHKTKGNLNNHIGVPLTLLSMPEQTDLAVVEMGMNHSGEIAVLSKIARPDVAVITNIGESHIEHLGSREGIARAKLEIREGLSSDGTIIFDGDEPLLRLYLRDETRSQIRVGWLEDADDAPEQAEVMGTRGIVFRSRKKGTWFTLPLLGRHNIKNALYAVEVARHFSLTEQEIASGLANANLTGMRLELKKAKNGMLIINDAYNASPTSMRAALDLLAEIEPEREKWALLGDILEIGEQEESYHREIGVYAMKKGINRLYTIGERGRWIYEGAVEAKNSAQTLVHFHTLDDAVNSLTKEGNQKSVLLVKASRAAQLDQIVNKMTEGA
ncbi:UDP-N-acetylmuramoyl-tripeptide--D-alanyl-D-alanine ligase [Thermoactinomyces mirandus]|uniref:UDP-N-acetylmuramoyl-tripeptide--D-alanyl-D-alanine ligase n=1 Tax=Thermoactinomyces mirandus TaxID=2756294 RepID=A0A7W1XQF8_9BACL|nr:UDP-N-acetylmuramoyl-tripeptide--D-alanyl-D-alanine ligase [Thermoactinomyces mirandus]MBA4601165.1 UDP-N-acetylmuramoyl-tripeptide--D-alanyl-D-alanine ligase [Thermoactinomyces mirandus]